jgi:hypothetical protein
MGDPGITAGTQDLLPWSHCEQEKQERAMVKKASILIKGGARGTDGHTSKQKISNARTRDLTQTTTIFL